MLSNNNHRGAGLGRVVGLFDDSREKELALKAFQSKEIPLTVLSSCDELYDSLDRGCSVVLLSLDSITPRCWEMVSEALQRQPVWSSIPFIILVEPGETDIPPLTGCELMLVDRPIRPQPLLTLVNVALQSRKRQYLLRDRMLDLGREIEIRGQAERKARFLAALVECSSEAIIGLAKGLDGTIQTWNRGAEKIYGYSAQEMVGGNLSVLIPPGFADETAWILEEVRRGRHVEGHETLRVAKGGATIQVSLNVSPIRDASGQIAGASVIGVDITERKRAEQCLRESEEKFSKIFETVPVGITISALEDGLFVDINKEGEKLSGWSREEVIGRNAMEFSIWSDTTERNLVIEETLKKGAVRDREMEFRTKSGAVLFGQFSATVIEIAGKKHLVSMVNDVTGRKLAARTIMESEKRFRALLMATSEVLFRTSADWGQVLDFYSGQASITDAYGPDSEWLGSFIISEDLTEVTSAIKKAVASKSLLQLEHRVRRFDGSIGWAYTRAVPMFGENGEVEEWFGAATDITERKRREEEIKRLNIQLAARSAELEAVNQELEAFNYTVAHDLRQPLNTIGTYCQGIRTICKAQLSEECLQFVDAAYQGTLRMNQLLTALLDFSCTSKVELRREQVNLSALAQALASELRETEPGRDAEFQIEADITADADPALISIVLRNLLGNAWKYSRSQEHAVIRFGVEERERERVYFVCDNGPGFEMSESENLFAPFRRLPEAESGGTPGFGIGLATVERIIRRHGGRVWATAERDKGATFFFVLQQNENR